MTTMRIPTLSPQQLVENYVQDHPGCTVRQIIDALAMTPNSIWMSVKRLRAAGRIRRVAAVEGERRMRWEIGIEPDMEVKESRDGQMRQTTVSSWEKADIAQQSWMSSLMEDEPL